MDDCLALLRDDPAAIQLLECLNSMNQNIRFELEKPKRNENNNEYSLKLLDLEMNISEQGIKFRNYTKPARKPLLVHAKSALPWSQKRAIIQNERDRMTSRCSDEKDKNDAIKQLRDKLLLNGYNTTEIQGLLRNREPNNRVINPSNTTDSEAFYINLPYLGDAHDYQLRRIFL